MLWKRERKKSKRQNAKPRPSEVEVASHHQSKMDGVIKMAIADVVIRMGESKMIGNETRTDGEVHLFLQAHDQ